METVRIRFLEGLITRDQAAIGALLTPDFLWREDEAPVQETPFDFWDRHKLWGELQGLALAPVFKSENVMVSPKGANNPGYTGPRLGWRQVGGEWRAAYFYPGVK